MSIGEPQVLWQETIDIINERAAIRLRKYEEARQRGEVALRGWIPPKDVALAYAELYKITDILQGADE
jgi:hypothetical protein